MISDVLQKWTVVIIVFCLSAVRPQILPIGYGYRRPIMMPAPMPLPMPMPAPMPIPMPVPVPVGILIPYTEPTTTTSTTEANIDDNGIAIAIPIPVPNFVQIPIPGFMQPNCTPNGKNKKSRPKNCPPCPPCSCNPCTPSIFSFCSPCHQECRCQNSFTREPNPPNPMPGPAFPIPFAMHVPPPIVLVPFPPQFGLTSQPHNSDSDSRPVSKSSSSSEDSTSSDSSESDSSRLKRHKYKWGNYDIQRRNFDVMERNRGDKGIVKPVLSYVSRNGDIKMKIRVSNAEADSLLGERSA